MQSDQKNARVGSLKRHDAQSTELRINRLAAELPPVLRNAKCRLWPISAAPLSHFRVRSQRYSTRASCELARQLMTRRRHGIADFLQRNLKIEPHFTGPKSLL